MATTLQKTPAPGVMKFTILGDPCRSTRTPALGHEINNFGRPFLGHHYDILGLSDLCLGVEKKMFKAIMHFHYMIYMTLP